MKLSAIKKQEAENAAKSKEALREILAKIDKLVLDTQDPDVTDEAFLADLETTRDNLAKLADIVPGSPESTETTDTGGVGTVA